MALEEIKKLMIKEKKVKFLPLMDKVLKEHSEIAKEIESKERLSVVFLMDLYKSKSSFLYQFLDLHNFGSVKCIRYFDCKRINRKGERASKIFFFEENGDWTFYLHQKKTKKYYGARMAKDKFKTFKMEEGVAITCSFDFSDDIINSSKSKVLNFVIEEKGKTA